MNYYYFLVPALILFAKGVSMEDSTFPTMTTISPPTTPSPSCDQFGNATCNDCVKNGRVHCYYCYDDKSCHPYFKNIKVFDCPLSKTGIETCYVSGQTLIIVISSVAGVLLLSLIICCCTCCRKFQRARLQRQLNRWDQQRQERQERSAARRADRETKMDEIRQKYGIKKPGEDGYKRFPWIHKGFYLFNHLIVYKTQWLDVVRLSGHT